MAVEEMTTGMRGGYQSDKDQKQASDSAFNLATPAQSSCSAQPLVLAIRAWAARTARDLEAGPAQGGRASAGDRTQRNRNPSAEGACFQRELGS